MTQTGKSVDQLLSEHLKVIGDQIRSRRRQSGMSIQELANLTDLSTAMISLVERGQAVPSLGTVIALATELGIPLSVLFANGAAVGEQYLHTVDNHRVLQLGNNATRRVIVENLTIGFRLSLDEWQPGSTLEPELARHRGHEIGYVLSGELTVDVEDMSQVVRAGDAVSYSSRRPHRINNSSSSPAVALWFNLFDVR